SNAPSDQGHHHSPATPPLSWNAPSNQGHHSPTPTLPPATQQISKRLDFSPDETYSNHSSVSYVLEPTLSHPPSEDVHSEVGTSSHQFQEDTNKSDTRGISSNRLSIACESCHDLSCRMLHPNQGHHHSPATPPLSWNAPSNQGHHSPTLLFHPPRNKSLKDLRKERHMLYRDFPPMKPTPTIHQYHYVLSLLYPILQVRMYIPKLEQVSSIPRGYE
ncbi:hypothetical protein PSHT_15479, partial [Puccinia striiformis]